jgi:LPXTG-motif cell wall-anchored protein
MLVQAVPHESLDVTVDGHTVRRDSAVGAVLGPISVSPGRHRVGFTDPSGTLQVTSTVDVKSGSSSDIVVHLPAEVGGAPVVNAYKTPRAAIAPGKARVLIAHTATVAPADVRVDGQVVFHDIANGEFATADIAAGGHTVALLPAGLSAPPILGPLQLDLQAGTVTMAYAYGNPRDHSMNVIAHTATLTSNGAVVPASIDTGRAGLATSVVHPFRLPQAGLPQHLPTSGSDDGPWLTVGGGILLAAAGLLMLRRWRGAPSRSG